ncbi:decarboxylating NADP(+)-dependent phosphogluconate dehydrogenase [Ilumatobacter sp.]|uniref:decarboxylating NADP(+)-dependent phosphogluconate dehydrogenase n=1 Tax=Ilumatobacter sp. TaxID=1967498 RepID=UPI003B5270A1
MAADIGLVGLAVMGRNLVLNMARNGIEVAVHNRTTSRMTDFVDGEAAGATVTGHAELADMVAALSSPRIVMLMVRSGPAVDAVLGGLVPLLDEGDIVIDGGNADHVDTQRRCDELAERGLHFVGAGISGGEEGALNGPSIMPGGSPEAWPHVEPILTAIAAVADDGRPCCEWLGRGGAGHFVKMVHNGIEYADMQVIAEAYSLMSHRGLTNTEMSEVFARWNEGALQSFLVEITAAILGHATPDGEATLDSILDAAGQKGTGRWTAMYGFELGQPVSLIAEAVIARAVSALVDERGRAAEILAGPTPDLTDEPSEDDLRDALYASKIVSYAQGFSMLAAASREHGWELDLAAIASIWRAGCIIRARFLDDIASALTERPDIDSLLLADGFAADLSDAQRGWREVVRIGVAAGVPLPAYSSALAFYDGYRTTRLPANLIQAQRDYFGAHGYERLDGVRGDDFHTDWIGDGAQSAVESYSA